MKDVLERAKKHHIINTYEITEWEDHIDFMTQLAHKTGKLLKKGEPDLNAVAKLILHDWIRGKIPYFVPPPMSEGEEIEEDEEDGEEFDMEADIDRDDDDDNDEDNENNDNDNI